VGTILPQALAADPTAANTPLPKRRSRRNGAPEATASETPGLPPSVAMAQVVTQLVADAAGIGATGAEGLSQPLAQLMDSCASSSGCTAALMPALCHAAFHLLEAGLSEGGALLLHRMYSLAPPTCITQLRGLLGEVVSRCPADVEVSKALAQAMVERHSKECEVPGQLPETVAELAAITHRGNRLAVDVASEMVKMLQSEQVGQEAARCLQSYATFVKVHAADTAGTAGGAAPGPCTPTRTPSNARPAPAGVLEVIKEGAEDAACRRMPDGVQDLAKGILLTCEGAEVA